MALKILRFWFLGEAVAGVGDGAGLRVRDISVTWEAVSEDLSIAGLKPRIFAGLYRLEIGVEDRAGTFHTGFVLLLIVSMLFYPIFNSKILIHFVDGSDGGEYPLGINDLAQPYGGYVDKQ